MKWLGHMLMASPLRTAQAKLSPVFSDKLQEAMSMTAALTKQEARRMALNALLKEALVKTAA